MRGIGVATLVRVLIGLFALTLFSDSLTAGTVQYAYDALGRLVGVTDESGRTTTYAYDSAGNRIQVTQATSTSPPTGTLTASPTTITAGQSTTLSWTSAGATSASIDNGIGSVTPVAGGNRSVSPTTTTTYTLTLTGPGGTITRTAQVTVNSGFTATIPVTGSGPINLRSLANSAGYTGSTNANIVFTVSTAIAGTPGGGIGIDSGTWSTGSYSINLTLRVYSGGAVRGGGGSGGSGGAPRASGGSAGGDAIYARVPMTIIVDSGGAVQAGGGGGGGGSGYQSGPMTMNTGGGGGGGFPNGAGGPSPSGIYMVPGSAGGSGSTSGGGSGGYASYPASSGAPGGGAGAAGAYGGGSQGGAGGAAGYAIRKNGNAVSVTNNGTISGTQG